VLSAYLYLEGYIKSKTDARQYNDFPTCNTEPLVTLLTSCSAWLQCHCHAPGARLVIQFIACNRWPCGSLRTAFRTPAEARLLKVGNAPEVSTYRTNVCSGDCTIICLDDRQLRAALGQHPLITDILRLFTLHLETLSRIQINTKINVFPCRVAHKCISPSKIQTQGSSESKSFTKTA